MSQNWQDDLPPADSFIIKDHYQMQELLDILAFLRSDRGCPWDRAQTHATLRKNMLEEAYEAIDAVDSGDPARLCDELGDVLMQVVFHAQMAREAGSFDMNDVISAICRKLISRHTHIFGDDQAATPEAVIDTWEKNKRKEKGLHSQSQVLTDVPRSLPALQRSYKVQQKAAQVGFDWDDAEGPRAKISEELQEIGQCLAENQQQVHSGDLTPEAADRRLAGEVGDLLFSVVNYARHLKVQPEMALNSTTEKFIRRFTHLEEMVREHGHDLSEMSLSEMDRFWDQVKQEERAGLQP
ncbi:MAG TPA: nucleoside triphosphate pyrophosphohydrolase [Clostridiales bacterium]|nr:nucleoside triphosphate pyrophosphohydrolase [Clostridiales bacterium]